jgi:hypothetical protein
MAHTRVRIGWMEISNYCFHMSKHPSTHPHATIARGRGASRRTPKSARGTSPGFGVQCSGVLRRGSFAPARAETPR